MWLRLRRVVGVVVDVVVVVAAAAGRALGDKPAVVDGRITGAPLSLSPTTKGCGAALVLVEVVVV